ncbi:hypothetical protein B0J14DRAFT_684830 [Halenospora varia]|nr:hypothetical protein B0J14DRAFT_684830 [Halenospora varia]
MADARKPASKPNPFVLDPEGDRRVLVNYGGEVATGLVSSHALRMASPVWKKFVNPPWKPVRVIAVKSTVEEVSQEESAEDQNSAAVNMEANNRKRKRAEIDTANNSHRYPENEENSVSPLDFREDDSDALLILFVIAHARFKYVPQRFMADAELLNLAILCEKYQCLNLVVPFLKCWAPLQSVRDSGKGH